jgi:hypothetical protein
LQHFIFKLILLFSAILSVNSALAVPLSSIINSDIQQVEYRQTPTYKSLDKLLAGKAHFQLTKNESHKTQPNISCFTGEYCLSTGLLVKLTATRVKLHYQQQTLTMLAFSTKATNLYFQKVSHQTENKPPLYKNRLS